MVNIPPIKMMMAGGWFVIVLPKLHFVSHEYSRKHEGSWTHINANVSAEFVVSILFLTITPSDEHNYVYMYIYIYIYIFRCVLYHQRGMIRVVVQKKCRPNICMFSLPVPYVFHIQSSRALVFKHGNVLCDSVTFWSLLSGSNWLGLPLINWYLNMPN